MITQNLWHLKIIFLGQPWKVINFFDVNSMYVSTFNKEMPTGRGFEWSLQSNGTYKRKLIAADQYSMGCVEWMDYMNNDPRFLDKNGVRQYIQHAWNGSEVMIGNYPVDGYVRVDDQTYVLQFDGCFWVNIIILNITTFEYHDFEYHDFWISWFLNIMIFI